MKHFDVLEEAIQLLYIVAGFAFVIAVVVIALIN